MLFSDCIVLWPFSLTYLASTTLLSQAPSLISTLPPNPECMSLKNTSCNALNPWDWPKPLPLLDFPLCSLYISKYTEEKKSRKCQLHHNKFYLFLISWFLKSDHLDCLPIPIFVFYLALLAIFGGELELECCYHVVSVSSGCHNKIP